MPSSSPAPVLTRRADLVRIAVAIACFTVAVAWPLLNLGSRRTLLHLWGSHGVDDGDIVSVIPFIVGLAVLALPWRRRVSVGVAAGALAVGVVLGAALGLVAKLVR